ncbi:phosphomannomutase/phosphoglucomutase [bacterium]|nr:phosphomannomutase/phosphoglucomutase [bacterium]
MQDSVFRVYDIRGKIGEEFIIESVYNLARSLALYCKEKIGALKELKTICVAMDARVHSPLIKQEFIKAFLDVGIHVIDLGLCSTPMLYFSQYTLDAQAGFMITASHNPSDYNGIKMVVNKQNLFDQDIVTIKNYFKSHNYAPLAVQKGLVLDQAQELKNAYITYLKNLFPNLVGMQKKVVFDCGNGAVSVVLQDIINAFEWQQVTLLCVELGVECEHEANPADEPTLNHLKQVVKDTHADLGIAFDGDGDRMGSVTSNGDWVSGDKLVGLFAQSIVNNNPGAAIVYDTTCSSIVADMVDSSGGVAYRSRSGHSFIKQAMKKHNALFGGELSSHFFFNDRYFGFDDGLYAALRLLELIIQSDKNLVELVAQVPCKIGSPQVRLVCAIGKGPEIVLHAHTFFEKKYSGFGTIKIDTLDGVRIETDHGWILVRSSNTQPVVCIRIEGEIHESLYLLREDLIEALSPYYSAEILYKTITW